MHAWGGLNLAQLTGIVVNIIGSNVGVVDLLPSHRQLISNTVGKSQRLSLPGKSNRESNCQLMDNHKEDSVLLDLHNSCLFSVGCHSSISLRVRAWHNHVCGGRGIRGMSSYSPPVCWLSTIAGNPSRAFHRSCWPIAWRFLRQHTVDLQAQRFGSP